MPQLDVSFMTIDPMLADTFTVTRRTDVIDQKGRTTPTQEQVFNNLLGVITQESPAELMRAPEGQRAPRKIFVASMFAFRGVSTGHQPDVITWNGTDYTITEVLPYSRYGLGTYEVIAESTRIIDAAQ